METDSRNHRAMKKTPPPIPEQTTIIHTAFRLPIDLRDEIRSAAEREGHSMNAEVIARLRAVPVDARLDELEKKVDEILSMMRVVYRDMS